MSNILVYVLQSTTKSMRYIGITNTLDRRLKEHQLPGSTVSKLLGNFKLLRTELYMSYREARGREKFLKSGKGREWLDKNYGKDQP